jgi:hypothetical protein
MPETKTGMMELPLEISLNLMVAVSSFAFESGLMTF